MSKKKGNGDLNREFWPDGPNDPDGPSDPVEGERLKREGMDRVGNNTPAWYTSEFETAAFHLGKQGRPFTSEDITARIGMPPNHSNSVGANVGGLITRRVIVPTGKYRLAARKRSHRAKIDLYQLHPDFLRGVQPTLL